jgi:hypothetical protein
LFSTALDRMQGNRGKIRHGTLALAFIKVSGKSHDSKVTILWDQQVKTNRAILNNKRDIIIRDNKRGIRLRIDIKISGDRIVMKETEKILKCK